MLNIKNILDTRVIENDKKLNLPYEKALELSNYVGLGSDRSSVIFVMGLIKKHGEDKVMGLKSYLRDLETPPKNLKSLIVWKLTTCTNLT